MLTWCKLHTDILGDAKLMRAARKGAKHLALLPWLMAWARAHDETDQGRLVLDGDPVEPEDVAAQVPGVTPLQIRACLEAGEAIGVLARDDDGALRFVAWDERSGKGSSRPSDRPEAVRERVRKHRETKRPHAPDTNGNAPAVTTGNDGNALRNALDREIEKEREQDRDPAPSPPRVVALVEVADRAVRPRLPAEYWPDLDALLERIPPPQRAGWLRSMAAKLDGLHPPAVTPEALGEAVRAFAANGAECKLVLFDGYVRRAAQPPPERTALARPAVAGGGRNGRLSVGAQAEANALRGVALAFGEIPDTHVPGGD